MLHISDTHRRLLDAAPEAYRQFAAGLRSYTCMATFDGRVEDLKFIDWLDYEQFDLDELPFGLDGVAVIWGNVLVRTGAAVWSSAEQDRLILVSADHDCHGGCVWPLAHLWTWRHGDVGGGSRFTWAMQEAIVRLDAILEYDNPAHVKLRELVRVSNAHVYWYQAASLMPKKAGQ